MSSAAVLEARSITFGYRIDHPVLDRVSLAAVPGRFTALLGPNGSGKTTLLRCLLGWLRPKRGEVLLEGLPLSVRREREVARSVAYVAQRPQAAFDFPVGELVLMGRFAHAGFLGLAGRADRDAVRKALERTGTLLLEHRSLEEISGGEAQRVMIARALAQQPSALLLDEPTSHLDPAHQLRIHRLLAELVREDGVAVLCVSHDVNLAARFAHRMVFLRDGVVIAAGTPEETVRQEVLEQTYGVAFHLIPVEDRAVPVVEAK